MLSHCPSTSLRCGNVRVPAGLRRQSSRKLVIRADANGSVPQHVLEARAWIEGWKFKQVQVSTLEEAIVKAAEYLEDTKSVRQAKKKAEEAMLRRTVKVSFTAKKPVKYGCSLKLVGGATAMGSWNPKAAPPMKWNEGDIWALDLDMKAGTYEFKVVTYADDGEAEWEQGDNRVVKVPLAAEDGTTIAVELQVAAEEKAKEPAAKK